MTYNRYVFEQDQMPYAIYTVSHGPDLLKNITMCPCRLLQSPDGATKTRARLGFIFRTT